MHSPDPPEQSRIAQRLAVLKAEHRDLDAAISRLQLDPEADELVVKRLKKQKLWLRDCIERMESALIPDEPA
ncbi:YdcH family protein [Luteimonas sp. MJ246]|uniref:YdcH family protein n=1 Tax=Luteimonas sp. MJ174 TaxID=3129237 RepID=UPI0031BB1FCB